MEKRARGADMMRIFPSHSCRQSISQVLNKAEHTLYLFDPKIRGNLHQTVV